MLCYIRYVTHNFKKGCTSSKIINVVLLEASPEYDAFLAIIQSVEVWFQSYYRGVANDVLRVLSPAATQKS